VVDDDRDLNGADEIEIGEQVDDESDVNGADEIEV
jgi:hypothetical protein